ncbi:hypothetical protein FQZ97_1033650 [compost metagenome]
MYLSRVKVLNRIGFVGKEAVIGKDLPYIILFAALAIQVEDPDSRRGVKSEIIIIIKGDRLVIKADPSLV